MTVSDYELIARVREGDAAAFETVCERYSAGLRQHLLTMLRDALLNDPQALTQLLKAHLVDGYYPWGSFSGSMYGQSDRTVTNRLGQKLVFLGETLNGHQLRGTNYTVANGNRVQLIDKLLSVK